MINFGVIFCGECHSSLVDSGYESVSTLKCAECGNEKEFKVGKIATASNESLSLEEVLNRAKREGRI